MHLTKRLAIFLTFFVSTCLAKLVIKTSQPVESTLVDAAVGIVKACYTDRVTPVGLAGNATGLINERLGLQDRVPVALIDATARIVDNTSMGQHARYKLQLFVVTASSPQSVATTLSHMKSSIWWDHMAAFIILDLPLSDHECSNADEILWTAWKMNVLNAKFVCYHRTMNRLMIYTFNPYTGQAPHPWQIVKTYKGENDHPWTLLVREYRAVEEACNELDFDKTNDLGGYRIRVSVAEASLDVNHTKPADVLYGLLENIVRDIIFPALNATPKVLKHKSIDEIGFVNAEGDVSGILGEVVHELSDFATLPQFFSTIKNLTAAYPHWQGNIRSLTQYAGCKSQLSKIISIIDSSSRFIVCLVLLITVLFFKFFLGQSLTVAHLNILRVICNSSLPKIPRKVAPRIYLGCLFMFALTMQGIFQGKLASLLTHEEPLRNVNTMNDLAELDHTIYGFETLRSYFNDSKLNSRYVGLKQIKCANYVLRDPRAACVAPEIVQIVDAVNEKLHMSRKGLQNIHAALPIRPDWPLERRLNTILMRSTDAHLIRYVYDDKTSQIRRQLESQEKKYNDQTPKILTLVQLSFAFTILGTGLVCAGITFIVEYSLAVVRSKSRKR